MSLTIEYACDGVVVFRLNGQIYYLRVEPQPSQLLDCNLNPLIVPNIDNWFQAKTHQRYSFREICDMGAAFKAGVSSAYTYMDLKQIGELCMDTILRELIQFGGAAEYTSTFWIELATSNKLDKIARFFNEKFGALKDELGVDEFSKILCRLIFISQHKKLNHGYVFKKLLQRIGQEYVEPKVHDSHDLDKIIKDKVRVIVFGRDNIPKYKNISPDVINNAHHLKSEK